MLCKRKLQNAPSSNVATSRGVSFVFSNERMSGKDSTLTEIHYKNGLDLRVMIVYIEFHAAVAKRHSGA